MRLWRGFFRRLRFWRGFFYDRILLLRRSLDTFFMLSFPLLALFHRTLALHFLIDVESSLRFVQSTLRGAFRFTTNAAILIGLEFV